MFAILSILSASQTLKIGNSMISTKEGEQLVLPSEAGHKYAVILSLSTVVYQTNLNPGASFTVNQASKDASCYVIAYPEAATCIITFNYDFSQAEIPANTLLLAFSSIFAEIQFKAGDPDNVFISTGYVIGDVETYHPTSTNPFIDTCGLLYFALYNKAQSVVSCTRCKYNSKVESSLSSVAIPKGSSVDADPNINLWAPGYYVVLNDYAISTINKPDGLTQTDVQASNPKSFVLSTYTDVTIIGGNKFCKLSSSLTKDTPNYAILASSQAATTYLMLCKDLTVNAYNAAFKTGDPQPLSLYSSVSGYCVLLEITKTTDTDISSLSLGIVGTSIFDDTATTPSSGSIFTAQSGTFQAVSVSSPGQAPQNSITGTTYIFPPGYTAITKTGETITQQQGTGNTITGADNMQFMITASLSTNCLFITGKVDKPIMVNAPMTASDKCSIIYYVEKDVNVQFFSEEKGFDTRNQKTWYYEIQFAGNTIAGLISSTYDGTTALATTGDIANKIATNIYPLNFGETSITFTDGNAIIIPSSYTDFISVTIFTNPSGFKVNGADLKSIYINPSKMTITGSGTLDVAFLKIPTTKYLSIVINQDLAHYSITPPSDLNQAYYFILASTKSFKYSVVKDSATTFNYYTGDGAIAGTNTIAPSTTFTYPIYGVIQFGSSSSYFQLNCVAIDEIPSSAAKFSGAAGDGFTNILSSHTGTWEAVEKNFPPELTYNVYYFKPKSETTFKIPAQSDVFFVPDNKDAKASCIVTYPKENSEKLLGYDIFANKIYGVHFSVSASIRLKSSDPITIYVYKASQASTRSVYFYSGMNNKLEKPSDANGEIDVYIGFTNNSYVTANVLPNNDNYPKAITGDATLRISGLPLAYQFTDLSKFTSIEYSLTSTKNDAEHDFTISTASDNSFIEYSSKQGEATEISDPALKPGIIALIVILIILFIAGDIAIIFLVIWCRKHEKHPEFVIEEEEEGLEEAGGEEDMKEEYEHPDDQNPAAARTNDMANPQASPDEPLNA